jgi:UDP-N-acetylglucosamine transferase subunit ALG13
VTGERPLVLATVGTDHHPFDRLLRWLHAWPQREIGDVDVLVQSGKSQSIRGLDCRPYLTVEELTAAVERAAVVVCHGGPATIMQARHAGHVPIVVPRRPELGEHVDGHQVRFASWMAKQGQIVVAATEASLHAALDHALDEPEAFRASPACVDEDDTCARFGKLVDELVRYRPR